MPPTIEELLGKSLSEMDDEELMGLVKNNRQSRTFLMEIAIEESGGGKGGSRKGKGKEATTLAKIGLTQQQLDDLDL
jgi:hypothetical protein